MTAYELLSLSVAAVAVVIAGLALAESKRTRRRLDVSFGLEGPDEYETARRYKLRHTGQVALRDVRVIREVGQAEPATLPLPMLEMQPGESMWLYVTGDTPDTVTVVWRGGRRVVPFPARADAGRLER